MKFTVNGANYMLQWNHRTPQNPSPKLGRPNPVRDHGGTSAFLYELPDEGERKLITKVELNVYYKDTFSKEMGRKRTMTTILNHGRTEVTDVDGNLVDLLDDGLFDKEARGQVWTTYFDRLNTSNAEAESKAESHAQATA